MTYRQRFIMTATFALFVASIPAWGQTTNSICDEIAKLNSDAHVYPWPRWQDDEERTPVDEQLLRLRAKAIPALIACLADGRSTIVYGARWAQPSVGMVAFSMLWDLFTACDNHRDGYGEDCRPSIDGVITWNDLCDEGPSDVVAPCGAGWEDHLKKHGRRSIQRSWQKAWTENKDRIYWDEPAKCFKLTKKP